MSAARVELTPVERGLKLLNRKQRGLHPRGQLATLRRIARRALNEADWLEIGLGRLSPEGYEGSGDAVAFYGYLAEQDNEYRQATLAEVRKLRDKVEIALAACTYLNREHELGFPVP